MTVPSERAGEESQTSSATRFSRYLREHDVGLREGVTLALFAAESESLAHDLARATVAAKGIFKSRELARQFESIAAHASSIMAVLNESRFVRQEMEFLTAVRLLDAWGKGVYGESPETLPPGGCDAVEREVQRIEAMLESHPISQLVTSIREAAQAGQHGAEQHTPEEPEQRPNTYRDADITDLCAGVFEELTLHQVARASIDAGDRQEQAGRFLAFVNVVCDRIHEILESSGIQTERPHPSDRTLKKVISERRE